MSHSFGDTNPIFAREEVLYEDWVPNELPEREDELTKIHSALEPVTRGVGARNLFLFGKAGLGKTAAARFKLGQLDEYAEETGEFNFTTIYLSCDGLTSSYQVGCELVEQLTGSNPNGHPLRTVYNKLYDEFNRIGGVIILVLDEIDNIGSKDHILYSVPRARSKQYVDDDVWPAIIGISNDLRWPDEISPKALDSLREENVDFSPYDANQLRSILDRRAEKAFLDGVLGDDVIPLCAAKAAQDKGSARQAIRFLHVAGQLASDRNDELVVEDHVRDAENEIERERVEEGMRRLTTQGHLVLAAATALELSGETPARTSTVYQMYRRITSLMEANALTERKVRDHLNDLSMLGILEKREETGGERGGKRYKFHLDADTETAVEVLSSIDRLAGIDFTQLTE